MSWITQNLINNRIRIHTKSDIESDEFNDLILIEKAIIQLQEKGLLAEYEIKLLENSTDKGFPIDFITASGKSKYVLSKEYGKICERLAYYLGGYFTDDGYLSYIQNKYNLDDEKMQLLRNFIKSEYRHKIIRKKAKNGYKQ